MEPVSTTPTPTTPKINVGETKPPVVENPPTLDSGSGINTDGKKEPKEGSILYYMRKEGMNRTQALEASKNFRANKGNAPTPVTPPTTTVEGLTPENIYTEGEKMGKKDVETTKTVYETNLKTNQTSAMVLWKIFEFLQIIGEQSRQNEISLLQNLKTL